MRIVAIIQARLGSTRLPGKVLLDVDGATMLERVVARTSRATTLDDVVIATTVNPRDDRLHAFCEAQGWHCFRGSEFDVLGRYCVTAREHSADTVVRITSDCPLIDPDLVDEVVREFLVHQPAVSYASNVYPNRSFPRGLDVEVIRADVLLESCDREKDPILREHVTTHIHRNPTMYATRCVTSGDDLSHHRWTVDTLEDLELVQHVYASFGHDQFSWHDVIDLLSTHPDWSELNRHVQQKEI